MTKQFIPFILLSLAWFVSGCVGLDRHGDTSPPIGNPAATVRWWNNYIEKQDPDFLAIIHEVSETHRSNGSTATYGYYFMGKTMVATYTYTTELPLPIPADCVAHLKKRLKSSLLNHHYDGTVRYIPGDCMNCTREQATRIWEDAVQKHLGPMGELNN